MSEANEGLFLLVSPQTRITEGNPISSTPPVLKNINQSPTMDVTMDIGLPALRADPSRDI